MGWVTKRASELTYWDSDIRFPDLHEPWNWTRFEVQSIVYDHDLETIEVCGVNEDQYMTFKPNDDVEVLW